MFALDILAIVVFSITIILSSLLLFRTEGRVNEFFIGLLIILFAMSVYSIGRVFVLRPYSYSEALSWPVQKGSSQGGARCSQ
ncbi:MAG TPA: hypothetical protein VJB92_01190 [Candidatus Paceibacterota bacterium]